MGDRGLLDFSAKSAEGSLEPRPVEGSEALALWASHQHQPLPGPTTMVAPAHSQARGDAVCLRHRMQEYEQRIAALLICGDTEEANRVARALEYLSRLSVVSCGIVEVKSLPSSQRCPWIPLTVVLGGQC